MTDDLDAALRRVSLEVHPNLSGLDEAVMVRVRERRRSHASFGTPLVALAILVAIMLGVMGGALSPAPASAASLSPFGPSNPLAPSTLLASDR